VRPQESRRVVVILLSEMGSLILAHAMFERLRRRSPDGSLHVVLFAKNREALDLLRVLPQANVMEVDDRSLPRLLSSLARTAVALWRIKPDVSIDCELFARISSVLSYLSNAPLRAGFHRGTQEGLYRGSFINRPVLYNPYQHISRQYLMLADSIDSRNDAAGQGAVFPARLAAPYSSSTRARSNVPPARLHQDFPALARPPAGAGLSGRRHPADPRVAAGEPSGGLRGAA
jgi:ADP-heptose:LPS heptosyltransferase